MNKTIFEWMRAGLLTILYLIALFVYGCTPKDNAKIGWTVNEDRTRVVGMLVCNGCQEADIEILVTDENTGTDDISTLTVYPDKQFSRKIRFDSDWISVDISIKAVR